MNHSSPKVHHADVVGSLLRPPELMQARAKLRAGGMTQPEYSSIEDRAVDEALRLQERVGLAVVTDGEMRRDVFFGFFVSGMSGLSMIHGSTVRFHNHENERAMEVQIPFTVTAKVAARECPGIAEFRYAATHTNRRVKVTLPSPMMMLGFWNERSRDVYPNPFDLAEDAANAVQGWVQQLAGAGCDYIQIDAPELNEAYADEHVRADYQARGIDPHEFIRVGTEIIHRLGALHLPGVTKALHVCKGNGTQSWIAEGGCGDFSRSVFGGARAFVILRVVYAC